MGRRPHWFGMLCAETQDEILERMQEVLGGQYFTTVTCNSFDENSDRFLSVEVRTSERLADPVKKYKDQKIAASLGWHTYGWVYGVHTDAKTQREARDGGPHDRVHFSFEPGKVTIDHFAPARYKLRWIFAVEHHDAEVDS